jgi:hypothetical protein
MKKKRVKNNNIKNPNKLISPFRRTHEFLISPSPFSIKKKKKQ